MQGYYDLPRQTAATLTADGWLRTGDLGAWDEAGNLRITGVRKDLLVLATGKKVSPRPLEAELEGSDLDRAGGHRRPGRRRDWRAALARWRQHQSRAALDGATVQELLIGEVGGCSVVMLPTSGPGGWASCRAT